MAEERLIVSGVFEPSGIVTGVNVGAAALQEFEKRIQQIAASLPGINVEEFLAGARQAAQAEIADLQKLQTEATRTSAALNDAGVSTRRMADAFNVAGEAGRRASEGTAAWSTGLANLRTQITTTADATTRMRDAFNVAGEAGRRGTEGTAAWQQGLANLQAQLIQVNQRQREAEDAATRTARAFGVEAAAVRRASESSTVWERGLTNIRAQIQQVQTQQDATAASTSRMLDAFNVAGAAGRRASEGTSAWSQGLANLRNQTKNATDGHAGQTQAIRQTTNALANLAQQAVGASSPLGNLAQVALSFSAGNLAVIGAATSTIVLVGAYRFLTTATRELAEANDKRVQALLAEGAVVGPAIKAALDLAAAYEAQRKAKEGLLAAAARTAAGVVTTLVSPSDVGIGIADEVARRNAKAQTDANRAVVLSLREVAQAQKDVEAANIKAITASLELGLASNFQIQQAVAFAARLREAIDGGTLSITEQIDAQRQLAALLQAQDVAPRAGREAGRQAIADDLAAEQQAITARASLTQQAFAEDLITRAEYFARRRQQAGQAAAADIANLRSQVAAARQTPANTDAERIAQAALITHLQAQIRLRQELIAVQRAQLDSEKRLSDQELLSRAGLGPGQTQAVDRLTTDLVLKPKFDVSEVLAGVKLIEDATKEAFDLSRQEQQIQHLADSLTGIGTAAFTLADVGVSLGFIGDQAARSLEDVGQLANALAAVSALHGATTGNIIGAIVSGASLIGGLFGGGPTEGDRLQAETNQRLMDLKLSLDKSILGAGALEVAARDVAILRDVPRAAGTLGMVGQIDEDALRAQLAAAGQTIEEWAARIEAVTGIDVITDSGVVIQRAAEAAAEALDLMREQVTQFGDSVSEQARLASNRDRIFGTGSALERNRDVILGGLDLGAEAEARVAAFNLDIESGRKAYLTWLQQMQILAEAGVLTAEQLHNFKDVGEFSDKAAEGADAFAAAAEDAAQRIADAAAAEVRAREEATQALQNSVSDAVTRSQFQGGDAARQFADLAGFLKGTGFDQSPALRAVLEQANTATAEGREALKQALFDLLVKAQFETLTPDQLGALSPDALEELIRQLGGLIDGISNDADRAADERARAAEDAERSAEQVRRDQEAAARAARQAFEEARRQAVDARREQERLGELRERLAGSDQSAAAKFARDVDRLRDAMPQVGDILEGLDLDDPKSREVLRKRLAALFDQFTGGDFEKLNFTRDEFLAFLEKGADFLDEFGNSVNDATKSMLNFPTGINLAALEFQAQAAGAKDVARILPVALPSRRGTDGAALPQIIDDRLERAVVALAERTGGDTITYNVTVHLPRGSTAEQARAFVEALKRQSVVRTGSPDKWSQG